MGEGSKGGQTGLNHWTDSDMDRDATDWTMDTTVAIETVRATEKFLESQDPKPIGISGQAICSGCHPKPLGFGTRASGDGLLWLTEIPTLKSQIRHLYRGLKVTGENF